jgi:hypothetical protein
MTSNHGGLLQGWVLLACSMWWVNRYTSERCSDSVHTSL